MLRYAILALISWLFLLEASVMGHYESTQLGTGFWASASLRGSLLRLPPWAGRELSSHLRSLSGRGNAVQTANQRGRARPSPVSLARRRLPQP